jgi:ADP-ribosylation factor-like protein 8
MSFFRKFMDWVRALFWRQEMEITLVGLQSAGKTTLLNGISDGTLGAEKDTIPTIGLNTRKVTKGNVSIKLWDIGGQPRFRSMWERYCRGVSAIVFVVDSVDAQSLPLARQCLLDLLSKPTLQSIPLLVLANKNDVPGARDERQVANELDLPSFQGSRNVAIFSISAKRMTNVDAALQWLTHNAAKKQA